MAAIRRADVRWNGDLTSGSGTVSATSSGAFSDLPVSWAARTEASDGKTSPEELVAAAHASCYAMAFSGRLARAGTPPQSLAVSAQAAAQPPSKLGLAKGATIDVETAIEALVKKSAPTTSTATPSSRN